MRSTEDIVWVIDPDETIHEALTALLDAAGKRAVCYRSAEAFLDSDFDEGCKCGCVLAEADLPGMGSLALLRRLRDRGVKVPVVVLTSTSNRVIAEQALIAGAVEVIEKPLVCDQLISHLQHVTSHFYNCRRESDG